MLTSSQEKGKLFKFMFGNEHTDRFVLVYKNLQGNAYREAKLCAAKKYNCNE